MALDDDIRVLSGVDLFEPFTQEQLRLLAFGAENLRLAAGRELYREGSAAESAFVVVDGAIELFRERDGRRQKLSVVGPGALLGEVALIAPSRRLTSATAVVDTELLRLNRKLFRRILEEYPETAALLHRRMAERLQALIREIERLAPRFADG
jgi:CRP-like cAMP-binding protein